MANRSPPMPFIIGATRPMAAFAATAASTALPPLSRTAGRDRLFRCHDPILGDHHGTGLRPVTGCERRDREAGRRQTSRDQRNNSPVAHETFPRLAFFCYLQYRW